MRTIPTTSMYLATILVVIICLYNCPLTSSFSSYNIANRLLQTTTTATTSNTFSFKLHDVNTINNNNNN